MKVLDESFAKNCNQDTTGRLMIAIFIQNRHLKPSSKTVIQNVPIHSKPGSTNKCLLKIAIRTQLVVSWLPPWASKGGLTPDPPMEVWSQPSSKTFIKNLHQNLHPKPSSKIWVDHQVFAKNCDQNHIE